MARLSGERRRHRRHMLKCPVNLADKTGSCIVTAKTINISDGGMLVPLDAQASPQPGLPISMKLSIPRSTPNTFLMQPVVGKAIFVRHETPDSDSNDGNVAFQFEPPLELDLEV